MRIVRVYGARAIAPIGVNPQDIIWPEDALARRPQWLTKEPTQETRKRAQEIIEIIQNWIPKQRFKSEEAYEAALAEYLVAQGVPAAEQQGAPLADILAAHEVGIEVKS